MSSLSVGQELVDKLVNQDTIHRPSARQLVQAPYFGSVLAFKSISFVCENCQEALANTAVCKN